MGTNQKCKTSAGFVEARKFAFVFCAFFCFSIISNVEAQNLRLLFPPNGSEVELTNEVTLEWANTGDYYDVFIKTDGNYERVAAKQKETTLKLSNLEKEKVYTWQVMAYKVDGTFHKLSSPQTFTTNEI